MDVTLHGMIKKWESVFTELPYPFLPLRPGSYRVRWNKRMRTRAGVCSPSESLIELNPNVLITVAALEETLVHELCHLAVYRRFPTAEAHGQKWQRLMGLCGFKPRRCHDYHVEKRIQHRRWPVECACTGHQVPTITYNRILKGIQYRCLKCRRILKAPQSQRSAPETLFVVEEAPLRRGTQGLALIRALRKALGV